MILWISGNSKAGKSTAARLILSMVSSKTVWLDGDAMRKVWPGLGFSKEDRWEQNMRIARLADVLSRQNFDVVVSSICPYRKLRSEISVMFSFEGSSPLKFIFLAGGKEPSEEYPYEGPDENHR